MENHTLELDKSKPRFRRSEASIYLLQQHGLQVASATLAKLACVGGGPPFNKAGRIPLYGRERLDEWAIAKLGVERRSTSDEGDGNG